VKHNHRPQWASTPDDISSQMARTVAAAFKIFDDALNLDPNVRKCAHEQYQKVQDCLIAAHVAVATFLQGSFARKTMLPPLKDVDVVVILPARLREQLRHRNGPAQAMALLRQALTAVFPGVTFDADDAPAKALRVCFPGVEFTFDLVVAFDSAAGDERVLIGNRETGRWEPSNTRILNRLISDRNKLTGGVWVHQGRMLKSYKAGNGVLKEHCGLLYETLLYEAVTRRMSYPQALAAVLEYAATAVAGPVIDPTKEDDLTADWTPGQRAATVATFTAAAKQAREALELAADGDEAAAVAVWHDILGGPFPTPPAQSVIDTLRALNGGSITSVGVVTPSAVGRQPARPTRSWRLR
jgi:hypothetical protein